LLLQVEHLSYKNILAWNFTNSLWAALQDFLLIVDSRLALLPIHTGLRAQL
jgi:hypothetical protein